ncbi:MAG: glycosyltransferase family 4 protein [Phycisphaerae bacterium]
MIPDPDEPAPPEGFTGAASAVAGGIDCDPAVDRRGDTIGIVTPQYACRHDGGLYVHTSTGRVVDGLASRYDAAILCLPLVTGPPDTSRDYRITASNLDVIPQPAYGSIVGALRHVAGISVAYLRVARRADVLFARGLFPYAAVLYAAARIHHCAICHWIVGDPIALLGTHTRVGRVKDLAAATYARLDRLLCRVGRRLAHGTFLCNGAAVAEAYDSPRTVVTVSSTVRDDEFFERLDTCEGDVVRILFLGFIRPEKGVEYLIEAVARLRMRRPWELVLAGPREPWVAYCARLDDRIEQLGVRDRVRWRGYVRHGPDMLRVLRDADVFAFPTLSEGTPHVLVEARSNGLPVVATSVGGIPTMVADGWDGLLVPPKDPDALARAIDRVVEDGALRRRLIEHGLRVSRGMTLDRFLEQAVDILEHGPRVGRA